MNEIARLQNERAAWFAVAQHLAHAIMAGASTDDALNDYLRLRGSLEDPREGLEN